jgi:hypothetical protein
MKTIQKLHENFGVKDLVNVLEPKIHIDEFCSKIGKDDDIMVISFLVNDRQASEDLIDFFERGYDFILDADISDSELRPGSYLVFIELRRRYRVIEQIFRLLSDLSAASQLNLTDWMFKYMNDNHHFSLTAENLKKYVPLSPKVYNEYFHKPIEEIKELAGLPVNKTFNKDIIIEKIMRQAGIKI